MEWFGREPHELPAPASMIRWSGRRNPLLRAVTGSVRNGKAPDAAARSVGEYALRQRCAMRAVVAPPTAVSLVRRARQST
jgi:hypothetical protein